MPIKRDVDGVIINADSLNIDDVANERVLCPACGDHIFKKWPEGWDAHSAHRCNGITGATEAARKEAYKTRYRHLFR